MITKHHNKAQSGDEELMIDIDLSILGSPPHIYDQFEKDLRREYRVVPSIIFRNKRREILQNFLDNAPVYKTSYFKDKLEAAALAAL